MARIPLNHEPSLFLRIMTGYSKRKYGKVLDPGLAMMHNRRVLFAWLRHETAVGKLHSVPPTLSALAVMGASAAVGCSWCMDFGYWEYHHQGVDPAKLRSVPEWRTATVYNQAERDVLEYAEAMTATPPSVTDELVVRLGQPGPGAAGRTDVPDWRGEPALQGECRHGPDEPGLQGDVQHWRLK
ncbi:carboxymuconolactone decarboxylase family protein [Arthrobacter sp. NPDC089319]|uniref:carboxymuconolactone decarboxylase family protein n=1 Tax=Arthrobacter sp. NPDC089319 TaxID=3155915 RepID=UPI00341F137A